MSTQSSNTPTDNDNWKPRSSKKKRGGYLIEYRIDPEKAKLSYLGKNGWFEKVDTEWRTYYKRYRTEKERDKALAVLSRKDSLFSYRIPHEAD